MEGDLRRLLTLADAALASTRTVRITVTWGRSPGPYLRGGGPGTRPATGRDLPVLGPSPGRSRRHRPDHRLRRRRRGRAPRPGSSPLHRGGDPGAAPVRLAARPRTGRALARARPRHGPASRRPRGRRRTGMDRGGRRNPVAAGGGTARRPGAATADARPGTRRPRPRKGLARLRLRRTSMCARGSRRPNGLYCGEGKTIKTSTATRANRACASSATASTRSAVERYGSRAEGSPTARGGRGGRRHFLTNLCEGHRIQGSFAPTRLVELRGAVIVRYSYL